MQQMINYDEQSINMVKGSAILTSEDLSVITDLRHELRDVFLNAQMFRTRTEMEASVLSDVKFPTPDAKYWQSVREQNVMYHELVMLSYEYRKNQVEIKKLQRQFKNEDDDLEQELLLIEIEKKQFTASNQERVAKDRIREIREWQEIKNKLVPDMKCSLKDVNEHQLLSYTARWVYELITGGSRGSLPEKTNLISQLDMGLKMCQTNGLMPQLVGIFGEETMREVLTAQAQQQMALK